LASGAASLIHADNAFSLRAAMHGRDEGGTILRAVGNVAGQVAMYGNARLNMAPALFGADDEAILREMLPA
jgi:hypothetical protein